MEYLLVAPEFISDFLELLDPFEQCRIMPHYAAYSSY